jgi:outer membrane lipoprotein SlyB
MANGINQGTMTDYGQDQVTEQFNKQREQAIANAKKECIQKGGKWNEETQTCDLSPVGIGEVKDPFAIDVEDKIQNDTITPPKKLTSEERLLAESTGDVIITDAQGNERIQTEEELATGKLEAQKIKAEQSGMGAAQAQDIAFLKAIQRAEGQALSSQVGQFGQMGVIPTGLDVSEALTTGLVGSVPGALKLGITGAAIGAGGGTAIAPGVGTVGGAIIGAVAGFVGGLASSMISNFKSQRSDTTTAQQRVLDEGKQTMKDWATLAETDPANKARYLSEYNKVASQIDQAYRQMKLDVSRDITKFETALPNLAEFESFYAPGGERDTLDIEMKNSLIGSTSTEYKILELANRRNNEN